MSKIRVIDFDEEPQRGIARLTVATPEGKRKIVVAGSLPPVDATQTEVWQRLNEVVQTHFAKEG